MKRTLAHAFAAATCAAALGLGLSGTATAGPVPVPVTGPEAPAAEWAPKPPTRLHLTVTDSAGVEKDVFLGCRPNGGNHPKADLACDALHDSAGDFDKLKGELRSCTQQYDPVTAKAEGTFNDTPVSWTKTFGNACEMEAATAPVFVF
ncbi:SSI family serine proteinase inhibitor [Streptomyces roseoviridis]|uniref:SSI family serine proteinase inhibitor n=1 Tax=Streptomyces roseoviridis TaxID=67361 RepID=A0ABV5QJZ2_9ACTN